MFHQRALALTLALLPLTACTPPTDASHDIADSIDMAFSMSLSADETAAVLDLANTATEAILDDEVGLDSRAASGIVAQRPFSDLGGLDAVPYVGDTALQRMLDYIAAQAGATEVHGITEGSDEAAAIILLVNLADHALLDDVVGLNSIAVDNILDARFFGPIDTLEALDAISYMGPAAFSTLLDYVINEGLVIPQVFVHGISEQSLLALDILQLVNSATEEALDDVVGLNSISAQNIADAASQAPLTSLTELDAVSYVGPGAFEDIVSFIQGGYGGDPCLAGLGLSCTWTDESKLVAEENGWNDSFGAAVAVDGNLMVVGAPYEDGCTDAGDDGCSSAGAAYVFARGSDGSWEQEAVLKAMDVAGNGFAANNWAWFGEEVAISGDTIVIGTEYDDNCDAASNDGTNAACYSSGAAFVFTRATDGGTPTWSQEAFLKPAGLRSYDYFGSSIALDGDTLVVGAAGDDSCNAGVDAAQAVDGDTLCNSSGAAYIFERDAGVWTQAAYLKGPSPDSYDSFDEVAISGGLVAVGAAGDDSFGTGTTADPTTDNCTDSGAVSIFARTGENGDQWVEQAYLKADNAWIGDSFGQSVDLDIDTLVVGAPYEDGCASDESTTAGDACNGSGAVYAYVFAGEPGQAPTWTEEGYLKGANPASWEGFGRDVALFEDTVVSGERYEDGCGQGVDSALGDDNCWSSGAAHVFRRDGVFEQASWSAEAYLKATDSHEDLYFGGAVGVTHGSVVVGATGGIDETACGAGEGNPCDTGAAYVIALEQ